MERFQMTSIDEQIAITIMGWKKRASFWIVDSK
jgi:hypothetical protein